MPNDIIADLVVAQGERVDITVRKRESTDGPLFAISFPKSFYQKSPEEQGAMFVQAAEHAYQAFWEHVQKERS